MAWKPWKYTGYDYDPDINAYIGPNGFAHTCNWMAANAAHLRVK